MSQKLQWTNRPKPPSERDQILNSLYKDQVIDVDEHKIVEDAIKRVSKHSKESQCFNAFRGL